MVTINEIRSKINANVDRIAKLGGWPDAIDAYGTLLDRIPAENKKSEGFDAGIAAALDMIPRDKQKLIATLHAAYNEVSIEQIRSEAVKMLPHTETCWWLAASSIVSHEFVDQYKFMNQISDFELLKNDPILRRDVAIEMYNSMIGSFKLIDFVPFAIRNRGLQGAYLAGHRFAVQYEEGEGMFFLGTYLPSLGLESFEWADIFDDSGAPINGPVFGSKQYIKTPSFKELSRILDIVVKKLKKP